MMMQQTMHITADFPVKTVSKKNIKIPTVLLATSTITKSVKNEVVRILKEGLTHLNIKVLNGEITEELLKNSDIVVLFEKDPDLLNMAWDKGVVPVTKSFGKLTVDYNPNTETGNSFIYESTNHWEIFAAIVRACETYKFPYDWKFIVRSCKKTYSHLI